MLYTYNVMELKVLYPIIYLNEKFFTYIYKQANEILTGNKYVVAV